MKRDVLLHLLLWMCLATWANGIDSLFQRQLPAQEKVFVQLDNNWYFTGDTLWYKAYTVRADKHTVSPLSRILYVELLDEQGYTLERQQLTIDQRGQSHGQFCIGDSAWAGYYEIRAYTKWMMNKGEGIFGRAFPVFVRPDTLEHFRRHVIPRKITVGDYLPEYYLEPLNVKWRAEGGSLVYGQRGHVVYEVFDEEGKRMNVQGLLMENGKPLLTLHAMKAGRGDFFFTPMVGASYQMVFTQNEKTYTEPLDRIQEEGCTLFCTTDEDMLHVRVQSTTERLVGKKMYLSVCCRGRLQKLDSLTLSGDSANVAYPQNLFPTGVNDIAVFETAGGKLAEQQVFIRHGKDEDIISSLQTTILGQQHGLKPRQKCSLDLFVRDHFSGRPLRNATFSISVRDKGQMVPSFDRRNIRTEFLLQSEVSDFVETPQTYLDGDFSIGHLLTLHPQQTYRWEEMAKAHLYEPRLQPEQRPCISGSTYDLVDNIWVNNKGSKTLTATLFRDDRRMWSPELLDSTYLFRTKLVCDSTGRYNFEIPAFYGEGYLHMVAKYDRKASKKNYDKLLHDNNILICRDDFYPEEARQYNWFEVHEQDTLMEMNLLTEEDKANGIYSSKTLAGVTVRARHRQFQKIRWDKPVVSYDFLDFLNRLWDKGIHDSTYRFDNETIDILNYLESAKSIMRGSNQSHPTKQDGTQDVIREKFNNATAPYPRNAADFNYMKYSFMPRLDKIDFIIDIPRRNSYVYYNYPSHEVLRIGAQQGIQNVTGRYRNIGFVHVTKFPEDAPERWISGRFIRLQGYNKPLPFTPSSNPYRHTLYWNPTVTTDAEGHAHIEFENSDVCTDLDVEVEGITIDGKFIVNLHHGVANE